MSRYSISILVYLSLFCLNSFANSASGFTSILTYEQQSYYDAANEAEQITDWAKVIKNYKRFLSAGGEETPTIQYTLGKAFYRQGNVIHGCEYLKKYLDTDDAQFRKEAWQMLEGLANSYLKKAQYFKKRDPVTAWYHLDSYKANLGSRGSLAKEAKTLYFELSQKLNFLQRNQLIQKKVTMHTKEDLLNEWKKTYRTIEGLDFTRQCDYFSGEMGNRKVKEKSTTDRQAYRLVGVIRDRNLHVQLVLKSSLSKYELYFKSLLFSPKSDKLEKSENHYEVLDEKCSTEKYCVKYPSKDPFCFKSKAHFETFRVQMNQMLELIQKSPLNALEALPKKGF